MSVNSLIRDSFDQGLSVMLWGSPGVGKSSVVRSIVSEYYNAKLVELRLAHATTTDIIGFTDGNGVYNYPKFVTSIQNAVAVGGCPVILFLDEFNVADSEKQSLMYEIALDRKIKDYAFPDVVKIVAAGNLPGDFSNTKTVPSAIMSRFVNITLKPNAADWIDWAECAGVHRNVVAFIKDYPECLFEAPCKDKLTHTPRGWESFSKLYSANFGGYKEYIAATVGEFDRFYAEKFDSYFGAEVGAFEVAGDSPVLTSDEDSTSENEPVVESPIDVADVAVEMGDSADREYVTEAIECEKDSAIDFESHGAAVESHGAAVESVEKDAIECEKDAIECEKDRAAIESVETVTESFETVESFEITDSESAVVEDIKDSRIFPGVEDIIPRKEKVAGKETHSSVPKSAFLGKFRKLS